MPALGTVAGIEPEHGALYRVGIGPNTIFVPDFVIGEEPAINPFTTDRGYLGAVECHEPLGREEKRGLLIRHDRSGRKTANRTLHIIKLEYIGRADVRHPEDASSHRMVPNSPPVKPRMMPTSVDTLKVCLRLGIVGPSGDVGQAVGEPRPPQLIGVEPVLIVDKGRDYLIAHHANIASLWSLGRQVFELAAVDQVERLHFVGKVRAQKPFIELDEPPAFIRVEQVSRRAAAHVDRRQAAAGQTPQPVASAHNLP